MGAELYVGDNVAHCFSAGSNIMISPRTITHIDDDYVLLCGQRPGKTKPYNLVKIWEQPL